VGQSPARRTRARLARFRTARTDFSIQTTHAVAERARIFEFWGLVSALLRFVLRSHGLQKSTFLKEAIGPEQREARFGRVGHGLRRVVVIGSDGMISLSALRWLHDQKAAFVMLERSGKLLTAVGPVGPKDSRLRRAQGLASVTERR
jgi:hypothetical protein